mgnify:FL=1
MKYAGLLKKARSTYGNLTAADAGTKRMSEKFGGSGSKIKKFEIDTSKLKGNGLMALPSLGDTDDDQSSLDLAYQEVLEERKVMMGEIEARHSSFSGGDYDVADRSGPPPSTPQFVDQIISSISQVESSGGKNLNHKKVRTGMYKGQTAMGEWAIMPGNIDPTINSSGSRNRKDSWINFSEFKELYPEITPDAAGIELLKQNPAAQRLIVNNQVSKNLTKTGDHRQVASIWFTGKRIKDAGEVKDDTGTTALTYLEKFDSAMENL